MAPIGVGTLALLLVRWRINVLSLGDDDAGALGVRPVRIHWLVLVSAALSWLAPWPSAASSAGWGW